MRKSKREKVLWEIVDPLGRKIKLTSGAYKHIKNCHPREAIFTEKMKETIKFSLSIWEDENIEESKKACYYFSKVESEEFDRY